MGVPNVQVGFSRARGYVTVGSGVWLLEGAEDQPAQETDRRETGSPGLLSSWGNPDLLLLSSDG